MTEHRIRWFARFPGSSEDWTPRTRRMQAGGFGWDVRCSCGWESRTGGAIEASVKRDIEQHRSDAAWAERASAPHEFEPSAIVPGYCDRCAQRPGAAVHAEASGAPAIGALKLGA